jgi:hypothetical protein
MTYIPDIANFVPAHPGDSNKFENLLPGYTGWLEFTNTSAMILVFGASEKFNTSVTKYVYPGMRSYLYVDASENANFIYWNAGQALYDASQMAPVVPLNGGVKVCGYTIETPPVTLNDVFILTNLVTQNYQLNNYNYDGLHQCDNPGTGTYVLDTSSSSKFRIIIQNNKTWPGGFVTSVAMNIDAANATGKYRLCLFDASGNFLWNSPLNNFYQGGGGVYQQHWYRQLVGQFIPASDGIFLVMYIDKTLSGFQYTSFSQTPDRLSYDDTNNFAAPLSGYGWLPPPLFEISYQQKWVAGVG